MSSGWWGKCSCFLHLPAPDEATGKQKELIRPVGMQMATLGSSPPILDCSLAQGNGLFLWATRTFFLAPKHPEVEGTVDSTAHAGRRSMRNGLAEEVCSPRGLIFFQNELPGLSAFHSLNAGPLPGAETASLRDRRASRWTGSRSPLPHPAKMGRDSHRPFPAVGQPWLH